MSEGTLLERLLAPRVILPILVAILVFAALVTPAAVGDKAAHLTTYSVEARGARGFQETLERLGYRTSRMEHAFGDTMRVDVTWAVMAPVIRMSEREIGRLLGAVRAGANLLYVSGSPGPLFDSLQLSERPGFASEVDSSAGVFSAIAELPPGCRRPPVDLPSGLGTLPQSFSTARAELQDTITFVGATSTGRASARPVKVAFGMRLGNGRVVVVSQPNMFRNDVIRRCDRREGVVAVRIMEWLGEPKDREVLFDEWHHGYGEREEMMDVVRRAVISSPAGRAMLQLVAASLVLLMVAGVRPIPPRPRETIERRSPFEHVGALARAYENVKATRRATRLLVRGLRRRHDAAAWRIGSDQDYLNAVKMSHPRLAPQVDLLLRALQQPPSPAEFIEVGKAVEHIERALTSAYS
jgi:hypothetical protein